jgi:K+-transporting ATPase ATPase C chain
MTMFTLLRTATILLLLLSLLTGVLYPALVTLAAQLAFPQPANGSLIVRDGRPVGSELVGQSFTRPEYFWGRLSATSPVPYNAAASSGSNYGPLHPGLSESADARIASLRANGSPKTNVPVDLVTASGSGLDPHISPAAAEFQVNRVAAARKLPEDAIRELVRQHTADRQFGVLGEPRINVLILNLALDEGRFEQ